MRRLSTFERMTEDDWESHRSAAAGWRSEDADDTPYRESVIDAIVGLSERELVQLAAFVAGHSPDAVRTWFRGRGIVL